MKLWFEIEYEVDGEMTLEQIERAAFSLIESGVVTSESLGDGEDYALLIKSVTLLNKTPQ